MRQFLLFEFLIDTNEIVASLKFCPTFVCSTLAAAIIIVPGGEFTVELNSPDHAPTVTRGCSRVIGS